MSVLVIALDAAGPLEVRDDEVLVVAPAVNSRLRHWLSDDDEARRVAEERLAACVDRLERAGVHARGRVGDPDPVQAIADALPTFPADTVVIAAHPDRSSRLGRAVADRARSRFGLPIVESGVRSGCGRRRSRGPESPSFPF
jgi:nucleotide-binding universal stress UspA family protein